MFAKFDALLLSLIKSKRSRDRVIFSILIAIALLSWQLPLIADETYYLWWSTIPNLGYFDHPPAVMLWAWISEQWLWGPRAMNFLSLITCGGLLLSTARHLKLLGREWMPIALMCTPFAIALGVLLTPDIPLTLGWCLTLWGWAAHAPIRSGIGASLMLWSKPSALLPLCLLSMVWSYSRPQNDFKTSHIELAKAGVICLLLYSPHLWWSSTHEWLPWSFQAGRRWGDFGLIEWIASQCWLISPIWAYVSVCIAYKTIRDFRLSQEHRSRTSLAFLGLGQLMVWAFISLRIRVEGNWSALAWPPLLLLAIDHLSSSNWQLSLKALRWGILMILPLFTLPILHQLLPLSSGPPRAPIALYHRIQNCLSEIQQTQNIPSQLPMIAGRYQEMAMILWAKDHIHHPSSPLEYLNANQRRQSEFSRRGMNSKRTCNYLYLGTPTWLGDRCKGDLIVLNHAHCQLSDQLIPTLCLCPKSPHMP